MLYIPPVCMSSTCGHAVPTADQLARIQAFREVHAHSETSQERKYILDEFIVWIYANNLETC